MKPKSQTIEQYKILIWVDKNFEQNIKVELIERATAKIIDNYGESITVSINPNNEIFNLDTKEIYGKL